MKLSDLKYLGGYLITIIAFCSIYFAGIYSYAGLFFAFFFVPVVEFFVPQSKENHSEESKKERVNTKFFDILLYLNLPFNILLLAFFLYKAYNFGFTAFEYGGQISTLGILLGAAGINVAHEIGHRNNKFDQFYSKALLLFSFYMHFNIEHNRGHHKNIATPEDPATSRFGENVYTFYFRSVINSYLSAWNLEKIRLQRAKQNVISLNNEMIIFTIIQIAYFCLAGFLTTWTLAWMIFAIGVFSFLLLETINYIEHYGLMRKKDERGIYERVDKIHSWNSNHEFGRIVLYELTRHSDHHYRSTKKYQVLDHYDESPQLPYGYPTSMVLSLFPPLWFKIMNKEVAKYTTARA